MKKKLFYNFRINERYIERDDKIFYLSFSGKKNEKYKVQIIKVPTIRANIFQVNNNYISEGVSIDEMVFKIIELPQRNKTLIEWISDFLEPSSSLTSLRKNLKFKLFTPWNNDLIYTFKVKGAKISDILFEEGSEKSFLINSEIKLNLFDFKIKIKH